MLPASGIQIVECAQCGRTGGNRVTAEAAPEARGFVCLGGTLLPSGRVRALCDVCVRLAVAAFARRMRTVLAKAPA